MNTNDSADFVIVRFEGSSDGFSWIEVTDPELIEGPNAAGVGNT